MGICASTVRQLPDNRYRSQHAAERAGLVAVGKFIFDSNKHEMRPSFAPIRAINPARQHSHGWRSIYPPRILEDWAFRDESIQVQARKLAVFPANEVASIPANTEKFFKLTARVHKQHHRRNLPDSDLAQWEEATVHRGAAIITYTALATPPLNTAQQRRFGIPDSGGTECRGGSMAIGINALVRETFSMTGIRHNLAAT